MLTFFSSNRNICFDHFGVSNCVVELVLRTYQESLVGGVY